MRVYRMPYRRRSLFERILQAVLEMALTILVAVLIVAGGIIATPYIMQHIEIKRTPGACGLALEDWRLRQVCESDRYELIWKP